MPVRSSRRITQQNLRWGFCPSCCQALIHRNLWSRRSEYQRIVAAGMVATSALLSDFVSSDTGISVIFGLGVHSRGSCRRTFCDITKPVLRNGSSSQKPHACSRRYIGFLSELTHYAPAELLWTESGPKQPSFFWGFSMYGWVVIDDWGRRRRMLQLEFLQLLSSGNQLLVRWAFKHELRIFSSPRTQSCG